jgi:hypothetical protein
MNSAAYATARYERFVRGVDDRVITLRSDVTKYDPNFCHRPAPSVWSPHRGSGVNKLNVNLVVLASPD